MSAARPREIQLQTARRSDARGIAAVKVASWADVYSQWVPAEILAPYLDEIAISRYIDSQLAGTENLGLIARVDGEIVGFAICLDTGRPEALLDSLHVSPGRRSNGIGGQLLHALAAELQRLGVHTLTFHVVEQNQLARAFYERHGARPVRSEPAGWAAGTINEIHYRLPDLAKLAGRRPAPG